ncbi:MAG: isoamylase early set domain-containing protein [Acidimicrobiales bacterium]
MIRRTRTPGSNNVKVSFSLSLEDAPGAVSVVGDFNDWTPTVHPMRKRTNGTRSAVVELPAGEPVQFKYLGEDGQWFTDPDADGYSVNEWGELNARIDL